MKYSKVEIGKKLSQELEKEFGITKISNWACDLLGDARNENSLELDEILRHLSLMEAGPEFAYSEQELKILAEILINNDDNPLEKLRQIMMKKAQSRDLSKVDLLPEAAKTTLKLSVDFDMGFADSEILSYSVEGENLALFLEYRNGDIVEIRFLKMAALFAMNDRRVADLQEIFESPLLERALSELYQEPPKEHALRIFRFLNANEKTALEVVCEAVNLKKIGP